MSDSSKPAHRQMAIYVVFKHEDVLEMPQVSFLHHLFVFILDSFGFQIHFFVAKRMYRLFSINVIVCSLHFLPGISTYLSFWMNHVPPFSDFGAFQTLLLVIKETMDLFQINNVVLFFASSLKSTRLRCFEIGHDITNYTSTLLWTSRMLYYKQRCILHFTTTRVTFLLMV